MQQDVKTRTLKARTDCIGCSDCTGVCRALLDLAFLPETVLRYAHAMR